jgi:hypothetical protein
MFHVSKWADCGVPRGVFWVTQTNFCQARPARPKSAEVEPGRFGWLFNITNLNIFKTNFQ